MNEKGETNCQTPGQWELRVVTCAHVPMLECTGPLIFLSLHMRSLLGSQSRVCPTTSELPKRLQKNWNASTFSCPLRKKRHFKDAQSGQYFLLL